MFFVHRHLASKLLCNVAFLRNAAKKEAETEKIPTEIERHEDTNLALRLSFFFMAVAKWLSSVYTLCDSFHLTIMQLP